MVQVEFAEVAAVEDHLLAYAVVACRYKGQWVYCQHKQRDTWEIPGGHREAGEAILDTAARELFEETGAAEYALSPVCVYSVTIGEARTYGLLCFAEITVLGALPNSEIGRTGLFDGEPEALTYPHIQPALLRQVIEWLSFQ